MAFDQTTLSAQACAAYIRIGRGIGSVATLAQANQTLGGLAKYGPELVRHGFGSPDTQRLTDVRDGLQTERVGRGEEVTVKRVSRTAVREALDRAGGERDAARTVLSGAAAQLREEGDAAEASKIEETLRLTAVAPQRNAGLFADQLEHLHGALTAPALAPAAADRGGPEVAVDLAATIATLRAADQGRKGGGGTPVATERLDLLDGIVVTLARRAFKAARAAGKRLGMPAIAAEFELTHISKKSHAKPVEGGPTAPQTPAPEPKTKTKTKPEATPPA